MTGSFYWTCSTSGGGSPGVRDNGDGTESPTCTAGVSAWQPTPEPWWNQQVDPQIVTEFFGAAFLIACVLIVLKAVDGVIQDRR